MVEEKKKNVYVPQKIKKRIPEVYYGKKKMEEENRYIPEKPPKKIKEFKKIQVIEVTDNSIVNDLSEDYSIDVDHDVETDNDDTLTRSNNQTIPGIPTLPNNQKLNNQNSNGEIRDINDFNTQDLDAILSYLLEGSQNQND